LIDVFGCGRFVSKNTKQYGEFIVEKYSDIRDKIIPFFVNYPLHGEKNENFEQRSMVSDLIQNKSHLTPEGLQEIKRIKSGMNKNR
jgi:hypothetical protein